jgi:hypothetical protein
MLIETHKFDEKQEKALYQYCLDELKDRNIAMHGYNKFKKLLLTDKNYSLVSFGKTVFFIKFENDEVEFHVMGKELNAFAFINNVYKLINYTKNLNVKAIKTFSNAIVFEKLFQRSKLNATKDYRVGPDGVNYNHYRLEY